MMTSTRLPEVDGKNSSTTKISLKEMYDLQQIGLHKKWLERLVKTENVSKKWANCRIYSTDTIREGYGKNSIKVSYKLHIQNKYIPMWIMNINIQSLAVVYRLSFL